MIDAGSPGTNSGGATAGFLKPDELSQFSECFITGSAAEVTPVQEIRPYKFKPGKLTETLMNAYADEVRGVKVAAA